MKSPFWCLFEFLSLTSAAVISPLVFLNTSESVNAVATQPIIENPDPRFKLEVRFDGPKLPLISCLMNTVEILMILGLQDFSGNMEKIAWKFDDYPHVGMVISPITQGGRIERRFAIWGLSQGVAHMIDLNRWQAVTITLSCTCPLLFLFPTQTNSEVVGPGLFKMEGGAPISFTNFGPPTCLETLFPLQKIANADGKKPSQGIERRLAQLSWCHGQKPNTQIKIPTSTQPRIRIYPLPKAHQPHHSPPQSQTQPQTKCKIHA